MPELVDGLDSKSSAFGHAGSSPAAPIKKLKTGHHGMNEWSDQETAERTDHQQSVRKSTGYRDRIIKRLSIEM